MKGNSDFPGAIIKATKNSNLTNILDDCKKFHGYCPYNEASNTYFNNGTFLLALIDEYSYENVRLWLEWCWDEIHWDKPFNYMWEHLFKTTTKIIKGENQHQGGCMTRVEQLKFEYEANLRRIEQEQRNCNHEWEAPKYDPEIEREPAAYEYIQQGVDFWPSVSQWREKKIDRWSRTCKKCGKVEYTKEQAVVKIVPKF